MSAGKKKMSPAEAARRKQASQKQVAENREGAPDRPGTPKGAAGFVPPKSQMFRHQGR
jgi:hypothetical protein